MEPIRLLLLEDDLIFQSLFVETTKRAECECTVTGTLKEAKAQSLDSHTALFCDLHVPDCTPDDVINWVSQLSIPVIAVTGDLTDEMAYKLGMARLATTFKASITKETLRATIQWFRGFADWNNELLSAVDHLRKVVRRWPQSP